MKTTTTLLTSTLLSLLRPCIGTPRGYGHAGPSSGPCMQHIFYRATCNGTNYFGYTHWDVYGIDSCDEWGHQLQCHAIATNPVDCADGHANFNSPWGMATEISEIIGGGSGEPSAYPYCPVRLIA